MNDDFILRLNKLKKLTEDSDLILIGAGAGLSTAAGFKYSGEYFYKYFSDFIDKYHFSDMYTAGFYRFKTSEEKWGYWARHVYVNRYLNKANKLYQDLKEVVKNKDYFVITTNVDHQFQIAGFDKSRLFYTQGDYGLFECSKHCHNKTYDNYNDVINMLLSSNFLKKEDDKYIINKSDMWKMKVSTDTIPKCPICGSEMRMNLRCDEEFVEDDGWHKHLSYYEEFLKKIKNKKVLLLELGVGYNTPVIIRYPFERMTYLNNNFTLVRINREYSEVSREIKDKSMSFNEDINLIINYLLSK